MDVLVARVAVSKAVYAIDKPYDYLIPPALEGVIVAGMRVLVSFGAGNRGSDAIVLSVAKVPPSPKLKSIIAPLDDAPVLDADGIQLALWMRERYFCTLCDAVKAMLPTGLYFALRDNVVVVEGLDREDALSLVQGDTGATQLVEMLFNWDRRGDMEQIRAGFGVKDPNPAIKTLIEKNIALLETTSQRSIGDKSEKQAVLAIPTEEAMAKVTPKRKSAPLRYAVTELLCAIGAGSTKELCYFTGASTQTIKSLEKSGILTLEKHEVLRSPHLDDIAPAPPLVLNPEQEKAFHGLDALCSKGVADAALLYGITGSGKTSVYIRLIQSVLERGQTAMVLVPEIVLTPQLLRIFTSYFGSSIAILHSSLRVGERYDEWKRIKRGEAQVVIGTRSAVFAPLTNIGLIVLDEEQEYSYKSENNPRYHAREVAKYRCVQNKGVLLLGSATPSVETMHYAKSGRYQLFRLENRFNLQALPQVHIADMKAELRMGNGTSISSPLRREMEENLKKGEQTILFLNRRGANRMVSCGECGEVPECDRCSVKLTYHSANGRLMCHYCGHSQPLPRACPSCGGGLNFIGVGTQRVQEELEEIFPDVEILRMDTDTITAANSHEKVLDKFRKNKVPILIGTQMVAKGLDFENVTLVGVLDADLALYIDDFRAGERTFSLITQVVGRAGRGDKLGRAVIQTYTPENEVIQFAARQDYDHFFEQEIPMRSLRKCPPFSDVLVIQASGPNENGVFQAMMMLQRALDAQLKSAGREYQLLGPAPCAVAKINGRYRYRMTLTGKQGRALRLLVSQLVQCAQQDKNNRGISIFVDADPLNGT